MEHVKAFGNELHALHELKPPISRAKMSQITKTAMKAIKFYKHIVQAVEKFIQKCRPEYKVPGLYVIDSIVRQSRHQYGSDKDVFIPRFTKNFCSTFQQLFKCPEEDKSKIVRVLNLWQKNGVLPIDIIQPLLDLAMDPMNPAVFENAQKNIEAASAKLGSGKKSSTDLSGEGDGNAADIQSEPSSRHTELIESITELLMQQNQQPVSPAAAAAAQQLQQQLRSLQSQLMQETAAGGSADVAAAALSNLETLAEQLLQQHRASLNAPSSGSGITTLLPEGPLPPPPATPAAGTDNGILGKNSRLPPADKSAAAAGFNPKLLDYDYDDSDEDLDHAIDNRDHVMEDSNDRDPVKPSPGIIHPVPLMDSDNLKPPEQPMTNSVAPEHLLGIQPAPLQSYDEPAALKTMPGPPLYGYPPLQHHPAAIANSFNGQVISLLPHAGFALSAAGLLPPHASTASIVTADGRLLIGGPMLHSSSVPNPPLPPVPCQPPPPPPIQNDVTEPEEDVDYRTDVDYRVLRDRDERERTRDDRDRNVRDTRRRSRSPRRHRSQERDSRHRRSRSRDRRNRSRSREREEAERKKRDRERERRHQGLPPLKDKHAIVCSTTLWIGRLNKQTTENDIRKEMEQYGGPVQTINLIPPRGCAFVCMATRSDATRALDKLLKGIRLHNNTLKAAWAPPKAVGENPELKPFWDVEKGCAYVPFESLPSDMSVLNGEGAFVDEDSLPEDIRQRSVLSTPPPDKEVSDDKSLVDTPTAPTSIPPESPQQSPSYMPVQQHVPQPFTPGGVALPSPHMVPPLSHQMAHSPQFMLPALLPGRPPVLMAHPGSPHMPPSGVPPPPLGLHPPLPGLMPGGLSGSLPPAGVMFSTPPPQRIPGGMPLGMMAFPPLPCGVPPPLPPLGLAPHAMSPLPPILHSHVSQVTGHTPGVILPAGPKEDGQSEENPQLAQAIENIFSNAASIQAVVQAAAAASAIPAATAGSNTTGIGPTAAAVTSTQPSVGAAQPEAPLTAAQVSPVVVPTSAHSVNTPGGKPSHNARPQESAEFGSREADDPAVDEVVDEDDEDDGGANSMGGPSALHQHHRQQQQRGQGPHRPFLPRGGMTPPGPPPQPFHPDNRRMPPWGPRNFPPPGFQGPPPTHTRPPPPFGFGAPMPEMPFNPRMMPPGMPPPHLGHHGPPPHGMPPHGMPPRFEGPPRHFEGPPPHFDGPPHRFEGPSHHFEGRPHHFEGPPHHFEGPRPHFDGPPPHFEGLPFDGSRPFFNPREIGMHMGGKPTRRSRWQEAGDDEASEEPSVHAIPPGSGLLPLPPVRQDLAAPAEPTVQ